MYRRSGSREEKNQKNERKYNQANEKKKIQEATKRRKRRKNVTMRQKKFQLQNIVIRQSAFKAYHKHESD